MKIKRQFFEITYNITNLQIGKFLSITDKFLIFKTKENFDIIYNVETDEKFLVNYYFDDKEFKSMIVQML